MTEPTSRDIGEIREWLVRIDTKVDFLTEVKAKADRAESKSDKAIQMAEENAKAIDGIKKVLMWAISLMVPAILTIVGLLVTVIF